MKDHLEKAFKRNLNKAEQGNVEAQFILGLMYRCGNGVQQNYVLAYKWFYIAKLNGHKAALEESHILTEKMVMAEIEEAERLAWDWRNDVVNV